MYDFDIIIVSNTNFYSLKKLATQQLDSEMSGAVFIQSITNSNSVSVDNQAISEMEKLEQEWIPVLRKAIIRDMQMCKAQFEATRRKTLHIYPFLSALSTEDYVRLLTQEVQMLSGTSELFSPSMHLFCRNLGFKVIRETRIQRKKENGQLEKFQLLYDKYCQWYMNPTKDGQLCNPRQMWQQLVTQHQMEGCDLDYESIFWPHTVVLAVGQFLYNIILSNLKIADPTNTDGKPSPAFYVVYRTKGVRSLREIKPHPQLVKFYDVMCLFIHFISRFGLRVTIYFCLTGDTQEEIKLRFFSVAHAFTTLAVEFA